MVVYRRGHGDHHAIYSAGTFPLASEARMRRDLVGGWLAQGLDPRAELARLEVAKAKPRDYNAWATAYETSRFDIENQKALRSHLAKLRPVFGDRDPHSLTVADQIEAVGELAKTLSPSSLLRYWTTHRQILDFAGVEPNPARHRSVKLPRVPRTQIVPPSADHFLKMLDAMAERWRLGIVTLEQTGMTIGEAHTLEWPDVDVAGRQFRLRRENVKAGIAARARWIQVPDWLMLLIEATCPVEDRVPGRRVFPGFTPDVALRAMRRACKDAGIPHYTPHELRHRRASLWHGQGVPAKQLAERVGHSDAFQTLNTYSHVMPLDEAPSSTLERLLLMTS